MRQLAHDEIQHHRDHQHRQTGRGNQKPDLGAPVAQSGRSGRRRSYDDRKLAQRANRSKPVLAIDGTDRTHCSVIGIRKDVLEERTVGEILSDHRIHVGIAGNERAVTMEHRDRGAVAEREAGEEFLEIGRFDAPSDGAEEFAARSDDLAREHGGPGAGDPAIDRFDQHVGRFRVVPEGLEIGPVRDGDRRDRPRRRRVDQHTIGIEYVDAADIGQRAQLGSKHQMDVRAGHSPFEILGAVDPVRAHIRDQVVLNGAEVFELLVEVAGKQQYGVFQFALAVVQRALAEISDHDRGADGDRRDQQPAARDEPANRIVADGSLDVEGTVCRH